MGRIRTIKPQLFRHEELQDLEVTHPGQHIILTFIGLLTVADANGVFEWKPRTIKLDVLPFIEYEQERTLNILTDAGLLIKYTTEGRTFGCIPTFRKHQRITGREFIEGGKHPQPPALPERGKRTAAAVPVTATTQPPAYDEVLAHMATVLMGMEDAEDIAAKECNLFIAHYTEADWRTKEGKPVTDWKTLATTWLTKYGTKPRRNVTAAQTATAKRKRSWHTEPAQQ